MSNVTTELRKIYENSNIDLGLKNYPLYTFKNINQDITQFGKDLKGNPITNYREYLNNKIIKHYYFREIAYETPALFVFKINTKLEEIMPYYNQMYESADCKFNPLWNVEMHETFTHTVTDNGTTNSNTTGSEVVDGTTTENGTNVRNEELEQNSNNAINKNGTRTPNITNENISAKMNTPQSDMSNDQIKAHSFLSEAEHNLSTETGTESTTDNTTETLKTTNDNTSTTTNNNTIDVDQTVTKKDDTSIESENKRTESYSKLTEGSSAGLPYSDAIKQWRNIIVNIDMMIINELEPCFYQLF